MLPALGSLGHACASAVYPAARRRLAFTASASDIYAPVSGEVIEVNKPVTDDPGLVNGDPYTGGWFFKLKLANAGEAAALLTPEAYKAQIGG